MSESEFKTLLISPVLKSAKIKHLTVFFTSSDIASALVSGSLLSNAGCAWLCLSLCKNDRSGGSGRGENRPAATSLMTASKCLETVSGGTSVRNQIQC